MNKPLQVNCPQCQKQVAWQESEIHRPFCSERCKNIDLGAWANEEYGIAAEPTEDDLSQTNWPDESSSGANSENPYKPTLQ